MRVLWLRYYTLSTPFALEIQQIAHIEKVKSIQDSVEPPPVSKERVKKSDRVTTVALNNNSPQNIL